MRSEAFGTLRRDRPASRRAACRRCMKMLLEHGLLHGDCMTITGQTIGRGAERRARRARRANQDVIRQWENPMYPHGHLAILKGNLAPEGAVAKITGLKRPRITGPARVFDSEEACMTAILSEVHPLGRRDRDPLRRPEGRARHARDALAHFRAGRRRARRGSWGSSPTGASRAAPTAWWWGMSRRKPRSAARSRW